MTVNSHSHPSQSIMDFPRTLDKLVHSDLLGGNSLPDYARLSAETVRGRISLIQYRNGSPIFGNIAFNNFNIAEWLDFLQAYDGIHRQTKQIVGDLVEVIKENELAGIMENGTARCAFESFYRYVYAVRTYASHRGDSNHKIESGEKIKIDPDEFDDLQSQLSGLDARRAVLRFAQKALYFSGIETAYQFESDLFMQRFLTG